MKGGSVKGELGVRVPSALNLKGNVELALPKVLLPKYTKVLLPAGLLVPGLLLPGVPGLDGELPELPSPAQPAIIMMRIAARKLRQALRRKDGCMGSPHPRTEIRLCFQL